MSSADWVVASFFALLCALALSALPRLWRHETLFWDGKAPSWWVWGESLFRGWVRGLVVATLSAVFLLLGFLVGQLTGVGDRGRAVGLADFAFGVCVVLFGISLLALFTVMMFNWPKFIVAPHLRSERGALADWRYRRRRR